MAILIICRNGSNGGAGEKRQRRKRNGVMAWRNGTHIAACHGAAAAAAASRKQHQ